jgi:hypothetical protein
MMGPTSASPLPRDLVELSSGTGFQASAQSITLIALDADGTLLNRQGMIPKANSHAIALARQRGVRVVLAAGRAFRSTAAVARQLNLDTPLICANGALIKDLKGTEWWRREIDLDLAREMAARARRWAVCAGHPGGRSGRLCLAVIRGGCRLAALARRRCGGQ